MHAGHAYLLRRLVDHPELYSRNRFPEAWSDPDARRLRNTPSLLRGLVRDLRSGRYAIRETFRHPNGTTLLLFAPDEGVKREVRLSSEEFDILSERCPQACEPEDTEAISSLP